MTKFSLRQKISWVIVSIACFVLAVAPCDGAVALNALGQVLAARGYGGAQLVRVENFFRVPISSNGKVGDLTIDTGASKSLIFRASLRKLELTETKTDHRVAGAFGNGREYFGLTTIPSLTMGNCTLLNMPVLVASDNDGRGALRQYGSSDGLLGLREMVKNGAILDLGNRLLFVRPGGPSKEIAGTVKSILTGQGYTAVDLSIANGHLRVAAEVNGWPCHLLVDSGAYLTSIDRDAANKARIGGVRTPFVAQGLGKGGRPVSIAKFSSLRVGGYEIRNASAAVVVFDPEMLKRRNG